MSGVGKCNRITFMSDNHYGNRTFLCCVSFFSFFSSLSFSPALMGVLLCFNFCFDYVSPSFTQESCRVVVLSHVFWWSLGLTVNETWPTNAKRMYNIFEVVCVARSRARFQWAPGCFFQRRRGNKAEVKIKWAARNNSYNNTGEKVLRKKRKMEEKEQEEQLGTDEQWTNESGN